MATGSDEALSLQELLDGSESWFTPSKRVEVRTLAGGSNASVGFLEEATAGLPRFIS
jgi:hypothetical protein